MGNVTSCLNYIRPPRSLPPATEASAASSAGTSSRSGQLPNRGKEKNEEKEKGKEKIDTDEDEDDRQHRNTGRMFWNRSSEVSCLYTKQGKKGSNQDAMLVWENFALKSDTIFGGVFDGHGPYGDVVANHVRDSLPIKLLRHWMPTFKGQESADLNVTWSGLTDSEATPAITTDDDRGNVDEPEMYPPLKGSFLKAFELMDKELKNSRIDCLYSGTTAVTLIKQGQNLVIANVGDSRAVLGTRDNDNNLIAVQLTVDLKPNLPREAARIRQCRGRVFALQDEPEVARVWLPDDDSPGLAMARSLGDFCLKDYGLISVPEIYYRHLTDKDDFIVLASDGVWDALSNKEVVDIVAAAPTRRSAARVVVNNAAQVWREKFPTSKMDDCTAVCLFLRNSTASEDSELSQEGHSLKNTSKEAADATSSSFADKAAEQQNIHESVPIGSQTSRSLADCISTKEVEEWAAVEGIARVNTFLSIPRFISGDKRSTSWRKWL